MKTDYNYRKIVMYVDLNGGGNLFGGTALAWIDEAAAISVMDFAGKIPENSSFVTKLISDINFKSPGHLNDIICISTEIYRIGVSSITLKMTMINNSTQEEIISVDKMIFVLVGCDGKSMPHNLSLS